MVPPCAETIRWQIARPRPIPCVAAAARLGNRRNGSNRCGAWAASKPTPLSATSTWTKRGAPCAGTGGRALGHDLQRPRRIAILHRVREQVLEHAPDLGTIGMHRHPIEAVERYAAVCQHGLGQLGRQRMVLELSLGLATPDVVQGLACDIAQPGPDASGRPGGRRRRGATALRSCSACATPRQPPTATSGAGRPSSPASGGCSAGSSRPSPTSSDSTWICQSGSLRSCAAASAKKRVSLAAPAQLLVAGARSRRRGRAVRQRCCRAAPPPPPGQHPTRAPTVPVRSPTRPRTRPAATAQAGRCRPSAPDDEPHPPASPDCRPR